MEQLFELLHRVTSAFRTAGLQYRVIGGVAVFLHVSERDPLAARVTRDIDLAVDRADLDAIDKAVRPFGLEYRHAAGVDMLVDSSNPTARSAVHLQPLPPLSTPVETSEGVLLAPVAELVRMKLTSYRLKDRVHIQDLDAAGLITQSIESDLPEKLHRRLVEIRATT